MMNIGMKGMGLAAPLAFLYHHIKIIELCNNKDNICYLLYLEIIILRMSCSCIVCLLYHVYLLFYMFFLPLAFLFCVEVAGFNSLASL